VASNPPPPTSAGPPPAFDPDNLTRTVLWAEDVARLLRADAGNALRQAETADAIRKGFRPLYHAKVRWALKVKEIKADGVVHLDGGRKPLVLGMTGGKVEGLMALQAGVTIDLRRARALNPGDEVVVAGLVDDIVLKPDYVLLVLSGLREHVDRKPPAATDRRGKVR
jgi:hypothetical protein